MRSFLNAGKSQGLLSAAALLALAAAPLASFAQTAPTKGNSLSVQEEHAAIGAGKESAESHTMNPGAQWFPDAGLGLFLHWDPASVEGINIGWSDIPGRAIAARKEKFSPEEVTRIVKEGDYNLDGKPEKQITPAHYWSLAEKFNPTDFDADKWLKAAKAAGFEYAVLTTKHHNGFALWPSKFGDFNVDNYMGGRDIVKEFVEACRKNNMKVGLYFSGPDWHFDRDYNNFLYHGSAHPEFPELDPNLKPRATKHTPEETAAHQKAYAELVRGQIEELLTNYGEINVLWFDGKPSVPNADSIVSVEHIRELQPTIVINPRLHGHGDYITFERRITTKEKVKGWAEFCNTWTNNWSYVPQPFRANGFVLGQLAQARSQGINYLLGIGPMPTGDLEPAAYKNMAVVADWMKVNGDAVKKAKPLPDGETASVPATALGSTRYLFALPKYGSNRDTNRDAQPAMAKDLIPAKDEKLTLKSAAKPESVKLLGDGKPLEFAYADGTATVELPASRRTDLVDVVQVNLAQ